LRGGSGTHQDNDDADSPIINLWPYFNSSCFNGFEGSEGFFAVYSKLFADIHEIDGRDIESGKQHIFYPFGNESSAQAEVFQFYNQWSSFVTQLSFSWEDEYNTLEAPNRQIKRAMEKENKKKRDISRKKYIETVRALVDYVKKRDIRYIRFERELRKRREEEEEARVRKNLEKKEKKQQQRAAMREKLQGEMEEEEKLRVEERKTAFLLADLSDDEVVGQVNGGNEGMLDEDSCSDEERSFGKESMEEDIIFACEICSKEFKTEAQQKQHFTSKVHRKKAQDLAKQEKAKAAKMYPKRGKGNNGKKSNELLQKSGNDVEGLSVDMISVKIANKKQGDRRNPVELEADINSSSDEESLSMTTMDAKVTSSRKSGGNGAAEKDSDSDSDALSDSDDDLLALSQIGKTSKQSSVSGKVIDSCSDSDSESRSVTEKDSGVVNNDTEKTIVGMEYEIITPGGGAQLEGLEDHQSEQVTSKKKKGKLRAPLAAATGTGSVKDTVCKICGFDAQGSRNRLFQHVKDFGHAAYKDDVASASGGMSSGMKAEVPKTAQKMSKKDKKKKQKAETNVRRNDYRF